MFDLPAVQSALREFGFDAWLLADFRGSNVLARRTVKIADDLHTTRRWFYCVPAGGPPRKLVHRIESGVLDHLPGEKIVYLTWQELEQGVAAILGGAKSVAMEYSPRNAIPYVSRVDAGTVELVRRLGIDVQSSGDLIQLFEACWSDEQWQSHLDSAKVTCAAFDVAWQFIADRIGQGGGNGSAVRETEVQQAIMDHFARHGLVTDHPPIVGAGPHSGDPHYAPQAGSDAEIREGDFVLIDLWAKLDRPGAVYSDYTRVGFIGREAPDRYQQIFQIVAAARDAGIERVRRAFEGGQPLVGWQVDDAARRVIEDAGYGPSFVHRTGHSIGQETHGNGANMDNLETHDERRVLRRTCFSIEPGIYFDAFGVRSEINVFIDGDGQVHITGDPQTEVLPVLRDFTPRPAGKRRSPPGRDQSSRSPAQKKAKTARKSSAKRPGRVKAAPAAREATRPSAKKKPKRSAPPKRSAKSRSGRRQS
jgi:Xaa-Pro aminopeptidase